MSVRVGIYKYGEFDDAMLLPQKSPLPYEKFFGVTSKVLFVPKLYILRLLHSNFRYCLDFLNYVSR